MKRDILRGSWLAVLAIAAGLVTGCAQPTPQPTTTPTGPVGEPSSVAILGGDRTALQTLVPADALSEYEKQAAARGASTYTGYACTIAPIGCACDDSVVQEATFTFTPENQLIYDFSIKGSRPAQWQLDHAGFNQWSYSTPITTGEDQQEAILLALLSFTSDGYVVTEVATFRTGEVSKCDNLSFHLLSAP